MSYLSIARWKSRPLPVYVLAVTILKSLHYLSPSETLLGHLWDMPTSVSPLFLDGFRDCNTTSAILTYSERYEIFVGAWATCYKRPSNALDVKLPQIATYRQWSKSMDSEHAFLISNSFAMLYRVIPMLKAIWKSNFEHFNEGTKGKVIGTKFGHAARRGVHISSSDLVMSKFI